MKSRVYSFLSSYKLSVYLLLVGIIYYIFLFAWGLTSPSAVVMNISKSAPFVILYSIFFINLVLCILNRWNFMLKRTAKKPLWFQNSSPLFEIGEFKDSPVKKISDKFRRSGYIMLTDGDLLWFLKGQWSSLANFLFHLAFLLIPAGIIISLFTRFEGRFTVVEGFTFWGERGEYLSVSDDENFESSAPYVSFKVEEVGAEFFEDKLFFTDLYAKIMYPGDTLEKEKKVKLSSGARIGFTHLNIEGYGFAPVYVLKNREGKIVSSATLNLNIFPPPTEDSFFVPDTPYRIYLRFYPDVKFKNTQPEPGTLNLINPIYSIKVFRGKRLLFSGNLKPGEECSFDQFKLSFPEVKRWGQFRIVRDPGLPLIWSGFTLMIIALFFRFFRFRREIYLKHLDGKLSISAESEWFREIYREKIFRDIKGVLKT